MIALLLAAALGAAPEAGWMDLSAGTVYRPKLAPSAALFGGLGAGAAGLAVRRRRRRRRGPPPGPPL